VLFAIPAVKKAGLKPDLLIDLMIGIIPCAIIGARLWYVLCEIDEFKGDFLKVINIRDGGLAIHGGVAGGALGIFIVCKIKKLKITQMLDLGAAMLPFGQAVGRWGNYFNQEVYGAVDPNKTGFPVSVLINADGQYHYALFLWEATLNILLFVALYIFLMKYKGKKSGYTVGGYFIGYGFIRLLLEPLRDAQYNMPVFGLGSLASSWVSLLLIIGGFIILSVLFYKGMKEHNDDISAYVKGLFRVQGVEEKPVPAAAVAAPEGAAKKETGLPVDKVKPVNPAPKDKED